MDVAYINPFLEAIRNVFETMADTTPEIGKPVLKNGESERHDVSGVIGLSGKVSGSVVLTFDLPAAFKVVTKFAGAEMQEVNAEFTDAIGELVNMVAGAAKAKFPSEGTTISLPSVITGKSHKVSGSSDQPTIVIPCDVPDGKMALEVSIKTN